MIEVPAPLKDRPFYVTIDGGRLYVSAHDTYHLEQARAFKRQIRLAHPDRNHQRWAGARTRNLLKARARWEAEEARWYARLGLEPPTRPRQRTPSVGSSRSAMSLSPLLVPAPAADRKPSGVTLRCARPWPAREGRGDDDVAGAVRAARHVTPTSRPTCHGPPDVWPAAACEACLASLHAWKTAASDRAKS